MTKRATRATIDELATECNRLEAENEVLRARLAAVTHCLGQLVGVSSGLHAYLIDEYFLCKQLEESRKDKVEGMLRRILFACLMRLNRGERRGYEEGYWRGWCNALYAIRTGEVAIDPPKPAEDTDKRTAYPVTAYAPLEQERHTDKVASTTTQQLPGAKLLSYLREKHSDEEAGPETMLHRAIQFPRPR